MPKSLILAIDQGTTSSRAIVFDKNTNIVSVSQREFTQHYPHSGWVEHDPEQIWETTVKTCREAIAQTANTDGKIVALGITNQRETTLVWEKKTGKPIYPAIVWQDRRTADLCSRLQSDGHGPMVTKKTGLLLDPYFSGTKIAWILEHVEGARLAAEKGQLAFGTVDSFLIWRLTGGKVHATDATNASRTLLYNIHTGNWDDDLLRLLDIPSSMLPEIKDCAADFGDTDPSILGLPVPIRGVAGDQQAAVMGQACFTPGMIKSTYGTGCFALLNTGTDAVYSNKRLLTTVAYQLAGQRQYALEGSIFVAGAAVQWLRDGLGLIQSAAETATLAANADKEQQLYLVPAFVGLGAPHWAPEARGAIYGLTRATKREDVVRATLEAICYQTRDLLEAMYSDWNSDNTAILRVDGGMAENDWMLQFLADILAAQIDRPHILETTALGTAWLAGHYMDIWPDKDGFGDYWQCDKRFTANMSGSERERRYKGWQNAIQRTLSSTTL